MRTIKSFTGIIISAAVIALSACTATHSFAQSSASSEASATIVTPSSMEKLTDLEFTNVPADKAAKADAAHARVGSKSRRSHAVVATGNVTAAAFTVSGYPNYAYGVTVPASMTMSVGARRVTIGTTLSSNAANYTLSARGTDAFSIAGTLSVENSAMAMNTNTEGFPVTVIYN